MMNFSNISIVVLCFALLLGCSKQPPQHKSVEPPAEPKEQLKQGTLESGTGLITAPTTSPATTSPTKSVSFNGDWDGCVISMFVQDEGGTYPKDGIAAVKNFEALIAHEIGSIMWFPTFEDEFPTTAAQEAIANGLVPHITWELFWPSKNYNTHPVKGAMFHGFAEVLAGEHDDYIDRFANAAAEFGQPIMIRFLHEFNGNWYVWSGNKNGAEKGGPANVVKVWRYVVDRFNAVGADNVLWLWVPHGPSIDRSDDVWNDIEHYWPGEDYVDWIGLDAYNWYPKDPWGGERPYRDFDNLFKDLYQDSVALSDKPIMIAEFGSSEFDYNGITKADWITDTFNKIKTEYPRIKMLTWFQINKERDWRVNSSPESLDAFKKAMQDPYYKGRVIN